MKYQYIHDFKKLGYGLFVHFGLYSVLGRGEWAKEVHKIPNEKYDPLTKKFNPTKNWAKNLVKTAKACGAKYITLTTRHHDGFSLFDTKGLSDYDIAHTQNGRDLVREFVDECNKNGIIPFFYHTLIDWHHPDFVNNFPKYMDYLIASVEILCTNYGKIGGLWFDGMWNNWNVDWQEDRLYGMIRKHQPNAMIINNTGMHKMGQLGHPEIDSITFERGRPSAPKTKDGKPLATEMCQVFNSHWGYAKGDINYKSINEILEDLVDCRASNSNYLLNVGPMGNGELRLIDKAYLLEVAKFIKLNKNKIYEFKSCDIEAENATIVKDDDDNYYAIIKNVGMSVEPNIYVDTGEAPVVKVLNAKIKSCKWLDNNEKIPVKNNSFSVKPYEYGTNYCIRIAKFKI